MIASADKGESVTVIGEETDTAGKLWYKIKLTFNGSETTGYVLSDFLVVDQPVVTDTTTGNATGDTSTGSTTGDTATDATGTDAAVSGDTGTADTTTDTSQTEPTTVAADGSITVTSDTKAKSNDKTLLWVIQILILVIIIGTFVYLRLTDYVDNKDNQAYKKKIKNLNNSVKGGNITKTKRAGSVQPGKQLGKQGVRTATKVSTVKPVEVKKYSDDDEELESTVPSKEVTSVEKKPKTPVFTDTADDEEDMELLFLHGDKFD